MKHLALSSLACLLLLRCAHAPAKPADAPWYGDLHALAEEAAHVRGLTLTQPFDVIPLEDAAFFERYADFTSAQSAPLVKELKRTLAAISLHDEVLRDFEVAQQVRGVQQEQLLAFYVFASHQLFVRRVIPEAMVKAGPEAQLTALAHEVGHVLQDQLDVIHEPTTFEAALTHRAVLEGDATLTATLVLGARKGVTPQRIVERARLALTSLTDQQLLELGGFSPKVLAAPALVRAFFLFPYLRGQRFMANIFQAGGLELVNAVLAHPPERTDAIFAAQAWLDGRTQRLTPLDAQQGRLGSLLIRVFLGECYAAKGPELIEELMEGYEDDSFQVVDQTLVWASRWRPSKGKRVKELFGPEVESPSEFAEYSVGFFAACLHWPLEQVEDHTEGTTVGVAVLGDPAERKRLAQRAAQTPLVALTPPPHGARTVPATSMSVAFRVAGSGAVADHRWTHPRLGLSMPVPANATVQPDNPTASLVMFSRDGFVVFGAFIDDAPERRTNDAFVNGFVGGFIKGVKSEQSAHFASTAYPWAPVTLSWTSALEARSSIMLPKGKGQILTRVIPLCEGKASFNLLGLAFDTSALSSLEKTMDTLSGTLPTPLCAEP